MKKNQIIFKNSLLTDFEQYGRFLNDIRNFETLTKEQEHSLLVEYANETDLITKKKITDRLVKANLRWIVRIAKQYNYKKIAVIDLINEGAIGLIHAIEKYDHTSGCRLLTIATWYIRMHINGFIYTSGFDVQQPSNILKIRTLLNKAEVELKKMDQEFTTDELIDKYNEIKSVSDPILTPMLYNDIIKLLLGAVSLNMSYNGDDSEFVLGDMLSSHDPNLQTDNAVNKSDLDITIKHITSILTDRERNIVELTYGLNTGEARTLDQIADTLDLTRERVGQILQKALEKMRENKNQAKGQEIFNRDLTLDLQTSYGEKTMLETFEHAL